jgi:hypothetical protein
VIVAAVGEPKIRNLHSVLSTAAVEVRVPGSRFHNGSKTKGDLADASGLSSALVLVADESWADQEGEGVEHSVVNVDGRHCTLDEFQVRRPLVSGGEGLELEVGGWGMVNVGVFGGVLLGKAIVGNIW